MANLEKYQDYGADYIQFFVIDRGTEGEWSALNFGDFKQTLTNANMPAFDPEQDLGIEDPDGELYEAAVKAAWDELQQRLKNENA